MRPPSRSPVERYSRPPSRSPVMFSGGDSPNSRYGRTLGASSAMKSFQERNSSPSLSQRPGASPRTGLQRDGVRTGKSQLPTLRPTQDGRQSTPQTVRKDRLAVRLTQSKLHDESEVKETTKVTSMRLSRKKTFEEQHAEMMKLFEEAKVIRPLTFSS